MISATEYKPKTQDRVKIENELIKQRTIEVSKRIASVDGEIKSQLKKSLNDPHVFKDNCGKIIDIAQVIIKYCQENSESFENRRTIDYNLNDLEPRVSKLTLGLNNITSNNLDPEKVNTSFSCINNILGNLNPLMRKLGSNTEHNIFVTEIIEKLKPISIIEEN